MKPEGHLRKAEAFESRAHKWDKTEEEVPSVIEDIYNAAVHYFAYGINLKYGKDIDAHGYQKKFLRKEQEFEIWQVYQDLEEIRTKSVYGASWNGERIENALALLGEIKTWTPSTGR